MNENMNIRLPNGDSLTKKELVNELKKDNIEFRSKNEEVLNFIKPIYTSYLQRDIISSRYDNVKNINSYLNTKLSDLLNNEFIEKYMPDIKKSTKIINEVIDKNGFILLLADMDCDGVNSAAIGYKFLKKIFKYNNFEVIVNQRKHDNGINDTLTKNVKKYGKIDLIITSDHGSSDRKNLTELRDYFNCKIIVTDHHLYIKEKAPFNMDAFINPQRYEDGNPFKDITGTHVLYYVLLDAFLNNNKIEHNTKLTNYVYYLLTYVGITIISDCMDLKNFINRKVMIKTLVNLNSKNLVHDSFWRIMIKRLTNSNLLDETTIGFKVAPLLNSPGRIDDPRLSYELLISEDDERTEELYEQIVTVNQLRKDKQASSIVNKNNISYGDDNIKVMLVNNSDGVQGIIASNVMYNENLKMVICFTKHKTKDGYILKGSGRSQFEDISLKDVVDTLDKKYKISLGHGGHKSAIGMKIKNDLEFFYKKLKEEVDKRLLILKNNSKLINSSIYYIDDYLYSVKKMILDIFDINDIGPFGIGYEKPTFASNLYIDSYRLFKRTSNFLTMKVKLNENDRTGITVFYNVNDKELEEFENNLKTKKYIILVYNLSIDSYRNYNKILLNGIYLKFKG